MFVKPKEGKQIRKPDLTILAEKGENVPETPYWFRRLARQDVVPAIPEEEGHPLTQTGKTIEVDVGCMTVKVAAGEDGELGTADDTVETKPKKRRRKKAAANGDE